MSFKKSLKGGRTITGINFSKSLNKISYNLAKTVTAAEWSKRLSNTLGTSHSFREIS